MSLGLSRASTDTSLGMGSTAKPDYSRALVTEWRLPQFKNRLNEYIIFVKAFELNHLNVQSSNYFEIVYQPIPPSPSPFPLPLHKGRGIKGEGLLNNLFDFYLLFSSVFNIMS
jgi:hypothetical protein